MGNNNTVTSQIIILKKIMQIENVSFSRAIEIIDALDQADLLNYYIHEMHKAEFEDDRIFDSL